MSKSKTYLQNSISYPPQSGRLCAAALPEQLRRDLWVLVTDGARARCARMGEIAGGALQAHKAPAVDGAVLLVCKQLGLTEEDVRKYGMEEDQ